MRRGELTCCGIALVLLSCATAQARVSHGYSGVFALDTVTAVTEEASLTTPAAIITSISPSPCFPRATITFEVAAAGAIELAVFDVRGRRLCVLASGAWPAGRNRVVWDGVDDGGRAAPVGTYLCRLATPRGSHTTKLTLTR